MKFVDCVLVFAGARQWNWLLALALATLASLAAASLLTFAVEQPANQWLVAAPQ